jgi:hypothetical protein
MKQPYTQLTLKHLRKLGYTVAVVEHWNGFTNNRVDLFNIIDLIAIKPGEILGVQSTSDKQRNAHIRKIVAEPLLQEWLDSGAKFQLITWAKPKFRYIPTIENF